MKKTLLLRDISSAGRWRRSTCLLLVSSTCLLGGCATAGVVVPHEPPREARVALLAPEPSEQPPTLEGSVERAKPPRGKVTLGEASAAALLLNPELAAFSWKTRAYDAQALQAGLRPNPELRVDVENVGGAGDRQGFEQTETTFVLSQLFELGGKRSKRLQLAERNRELAAFDYQARRLAVLSEVARAFFATLAAQERLALTLDLERVAGDIVRTVGEQVAAGASPPVERTRASVAEGRARVARREAERGLAIARSELAQTWGASRAELEEARGDLSVLGRVPSAEELRARLDLHPDLARWPTELDERQAALTLQEAIAVPNATVGAGGRHFSDNGDNALVIGISVPLPVLDRNQGKIEEARTRLESARLERHAAEVAARAAVETAYATLESARDQAERLRDEILPSARAALEDSLQAYRKGFLGYVDVLEAQRTLFEVRLDHVGALESFQRTAAELARLTATPFAAIGDGEVR